MRVGTDGLGVKAIVHSAGSTVEQVRLGPTAQDSAFVLCVVWAWAWVILKFSQGSATAQRKVESWVCS